MAQPLLCTVFIVDRLSFVDICGDVRDPENPNFLQLGQCRALRLEGVYETMLLRKLFCAWSVEAREGRMEAASPCRDGRPVRSLRRDIKGEFPPEDRPNVKSVSEVSFRIAVEVTPTLCSGMDGLDGTGSASEDEVEEDGDHDGDHEGDEEDLVVGAGFRFSRIAAECWTAVIDGARMVA